MNGHCLEDTPIAVDFWQRPENEKTRVYFLSHLHADHTKGLTSSWRFPFYTSPCNCALLRAKFQFVEGVLNPLELDIPHDIPLDSNRTESITVTLIDANHVPGAVMFLFQGTFGNFLYCGDMRFYREILEHPVLSETLSSGGIDRLYLDNTFCHPDYDFPPREHSTQQFLQIIERHPNHVIKIGIRNLGKEDLLETVALKYQEFIYVHDDKFRQMKTLRRPNVYTTNISESRIHAVILNSIHARNMEKWNKHQPTIGIILTALYYGVHEDRVPALKSEGIFIVPYSDHSSWSELKEMVEKIKPRKVLPIVKSSNKKDYVSDALKGRENMAVFDRFLSSSEPKSAQQMHCGQNTAVTCALVGRHEWKTSCTKYKTKFKKWRKQTLMGVHYSPIEEDSPESFISENQKKLGRQTTKTPCHSPTAVSTLADCTELLPELVKTKQTSVTGLDHNSRQENEQFRETNSSCNSPEPKKIDFSYGTELNHLDLASAYQGRSFHSETEADTTVNVNRPLSSSWVQHHFNTSKPWSLSEESVSKCKGSSTEIGNLISTCQTEADDFLRQFEDNSCVDVKLLVNKTQKLSQILTSLNNII